MMHRRDLKGVNSGIIGLRLPWVVVDDLAETIELPEECVREDVFPRAAAEQKRFNPGAPLRSRRAEWRNENEPLHRPDRRWLIHIDPAVEKELDHGLAATEYGEMQKARSMRRGIEGARRGFHESTQSRHISLPRESQRLDRGLIAQARSM